MLVEYLFIDSGRLRSYAEQIGAHRTSRKLPTWKVGLALAGPSVEGTQATTEQPATTHEMIQGVLSYLKKSDLLLTSRPWSQSEVADSRTPFVLETLKARKVSFQCEQVSGLKGLRELGVWVSTPTSRPSELDASKKNLSVPKVMFLYLVEGHWEDDSKVQHSTSEYSALNHVLKSLRNAGVLNPGIERMAPSDEDLLNVLLERGDPDLKQKVIGMYVPRDDFSGPIEVLKRAGGVVGEPRTVQSLYRMRSVSDNQFVMIGTTVHRAFDLFGYPIFITDSTAAV